MPTIPSLLVRLPLLLALASTWACQAPGPAPDANAPAAETAPSEAAPAAEPAVPEESAWFEDVAAEAGIDFVHVRAAQPRFLFPEIMGSGAAFFDYDGDSDLDLYLVQSGELDGTGPGNVLYRNRGDAGGDGPIFEDFTAEAGVGDTGYGMGVAVGDYDGDSDLDLYVTNMGPNVLYRNDGAGANGAVTFTDVTREAGVAERGWSTSAAFFDYDGDSDLDLFVVSYVHWTPERELECFTGAGQRDYCGPAKYNAPATDVLYRNVGGGRFRRWSAEAGLTSAFGYGMGLGVGDVNLDGRLDVYVANDAVANQLWIYDGDGRYEDQALLSGTAVNMLGFAEAGMGTAFLDYQDDGDLDLFVTHLREETHTLYVNQDGFFEDATALSGLASPSLAMTGFGLGFADFDHDTWLDLFVANGKVRDPDFGSPGDPYAERDQLFRATPDGRFEEVAAPFVAAERQSSRGAAFGDYDGDGDIDVVVVANGGRAVLYRNRSDKKGPSLLLRVVDRHGYDAVGARVAATVGERTLWRPVGPAWGYCSSNDPRVHFGLGTAGAAEEVAVMWVDGRRESFGRRDAGAVHVLRQGEGRPLG